MWLLHVIQYDLTHFSTETLPQYAILSHTWEEDEVLFDDIRANTYSQKAGFRKIKYACSQAHQDQLQYVWIDTCCIDKSSSAELSEAINSMYRWYGEAKVCYTYLADVHLVTSSIRDSRWFERGWTLQELIAPADVIFYTSEWREIGSKDLIADQLTVITGVDREILTHEQDLESRSVAQRMSWASHRKTTRTEDEAYCLMGIFDINMPLLYGEGRKAFVRLQEEIMKQSDDQTLFAWYHDEISSDAQHGLLAEAPKWFSESADITPHAEQTARAPYSMSNKGLQIQLPLSLLDKESNTYFVALHCCSAKSPKNSYFGIVLQRLEDGFNQYARIRANDNFTIGHPGELKEVYVRQKQRTSGKRKKYSNTWFQLRDGPTTPNGGMERYSVEVLQALDVSHYVSPIPGTYRPDWLAGFGPHVFPISKIPNQAFLSLQYSPSLGPPKVLIIFKTTEDLNIVFEVIEQKPYSDYNPLELGLVPNYPLIDPSVAKYIALERYRVCISAETRSRRNMEWFLVDIVIEPLKTQPKQDAKDARLGFAERLSRRLKLSTHMDQSSSETQFGTAS